MINEKEYFEDMKNPETEGFSDTTEAYVNFKKDNGDQGAFSYTVMGEPEEKFLLEGHDFLFVTQTKKLELSSFEDGKYKNIIKTNEIYGGNDTLVINKLDCEKDIKTGKIISGNVQSYKSLKDDCKARTIYNIRAISTKDALKGIVFIFTLSHSNIEDFWEYTKSCTKGGNGVITSFYTKIEEFTNENGIVVEYKKLTFKYKDDLDFEKDTELISAAHSVKKGLDNRLNKMQENLEKIKNSKTEAEDEINPDDLPFGK